MSWAGTSVVLGLLVLAWYTFPLGAIPIALLLAYLWRSS